MQNYGHRAAITERKNMRKENAKSDIYDRNYLEYKKEIKAEKLPLIGGGVSSFLPGS